MNTKKRSTNSRKATKKTVHTHAAKKGARKAKAKARKAAPSLEARVTRLERGQALHNKQLGIVTNATKVVAKAVMDLQQRHKEITAVAGQYLSAPRGLPRGKVKR